MPETLIPQFNYPPSPMEMAYRKEQAKQNLVYDPDVQDIIDMRYGMGPFLTGARPSLIGAAGTRIGYAIDSFLSDSGDEPLNFKKERQEADPLRDPLSFGMGNNLDGITEDLAPVPVEERPWLLSSPTYAEYQRRLMFIKMGLPDAQSQASGYGTAFGVAADISALMAAGIAAEGVAVAGLGTRGALAGRTAASAFGKSRSMELATAAAEAAATVSRTNLTARWAALGVAEEAVFQAVKNGIDPLYDPTAGEVVGDLVFSGAVSGVVGGAVFGRMFVRDRIQEAALELRRKRVTKLPGGYTIEYGPGYIFDSPAAADQMLFSMGTGSFSEEASKIGSKLWDEWESSPVEAVFTTRLAGEILPSDGTSFRYTTVGGDAFDVMETGALRASGAGDEVASNRVYFVSAADMNKLGTVMDVHRRGYPGVPLSAGMNADNTALVLRETGGTWTGRARTAVKASTTPRPGAIPVLVDDAGQISFGGRIKSVKETAKGIQPFRSVIKSIAFEISLAGGPITKETFAMIAKVLTDVERRGLTAGAFNKALWDGVSKNLNPEVVAKLRKNKAFIGGADRTVMDLVDRETMIDTITGMFRRNVIDGVDDKNSLIFHVLREIRNRGGTVNRKVVEEVVDTLRGLAQAPPTKVNKAGKTIVDKNKRRLGVAQLINKHSQSTQQVFIPPSLMNNMKPPRPPGGGAGGGGAGTGGGRPPSGTAPDFSDVPKVNSWWDKWWSALGNQAARLMRSENGAARLIGHHAFHAKRVFDKAQPQTIFELGTQTLNGLMYSFLRGYRQGWVKFAIGDTVDAPTMRHRLRAFGQAKLREEFHTRVMRQLRSGAFNDASDAVNETAMAFRELFQRVHDIAHSVGLKGFQKSAVANYAPRLWRWDRIRRMATTDEGRKALIQLVKKAIDQNGRKVVIDGVEQTIKGDIDEAATVFANRLISIAKGTEGAPLIEQEQELADALLALKAPIKGKGPTGGTPFGRARTLLDEGASISTADDFLGTGRRELSLDDLTDNNLPSVMRKYLTSIMGAVNQRRMITAFNDEMRARGVFGPKYVGRTGIVLQNEVEVETVEQMIALAKKVGGDIEKGAEAGLRELMEAIRYDPIHKGPMNVGRRVLNISLAYGYLTRGGQFGITAFSEISRLISTLGIRNMVNQMPILGEMITNWRNLDRDNQNLSSLLDSWFAPSTDRLRRVFMEGIEQTDEFGGKGVLGKIERGLNSATQVLSDVSGLAPITSFTQQIAAAGILQHLHDVARAGTKRLDETTVRALGLDPAQYDQIIQFVGKNAKTKKGLWGERIIGMDNVDAKDMDLIKGFVQRFVESRIQSVPTRGDLHKSAFTAVGRILTQFRSFNLKGVDNFLIQNVQRTQRGGGVKVAQEVGATLALAGVIQWLRSYAEEASERKAGNWERADELAEQMTFTGFVRGALTGPSEFFVPSLALDTIAQFTVGDPIFSPYRYSGLQFYGFPGQAIAANVYGLAQDAYGRSVGRELELKTEREVTTSTIRRIRQLLPWQNYPGLQQYFNILEGDIEDEYMLRRRQPRRRKEPD